MSSKRESVLSALHARLALRDPQIKVLRNAALPERIPGRGLVILRDGDPGEPEVTLSPLTYHWQHRAEIELFVRAGEAIFDALGQEIGQAIAADRTLGGLSEWVETEGLVPDVLPVEGAAPIEAATIAVIIHYSSDDPLS